MGIFFILVSDPPPIWFCHVTMYHDVVIINGLHHPQFLVLSLSLWSRMGVREMRDGFRMGLCGNINVRPEDFQMGVFFGGCRVEFVMVWGHRVWDYIYMCTFEMGLNYGLQPRSVQYNLWVRFGASAKLYWTRWDNDISTFRYVSLFERVQCTRCIRPKPHYQFVNEKKKI